MKLIETSAPQVARAQHFAPLSALGLGTLTPQDDVGSPTSSRDREIIVKPQRVLAPESTEPDEVATVIQIWEGTVLDIDRSAELMSVRLAAKVGEVAEHTADISLEWVSEQDEDLVMPGAVFYLTLSRKLTKGRSRQNSEELRFRRMPAWSARDAAALRAKAKGLTSKFGKVRLAE